MTIVLFLIDSSASMAQKTYQGTSVLDTARSVVEMFLKQRVRDASARGDRYMLMSFEDFPQSVKSGWREGQGVFQEQLKALKPRGLTTFGTALGSAFRFVNVNRLQTGIDNYGCGRYPFYMEPVVIISITDGNSLTCPTTGTVGEIKFPKPIAIGNELTEEPFRWDQRLFALVLRLTGTASKTRVVPGMVLPPDNSPIDAMCVATGGRSYGITSHKMLSMCVESIVQKMQQQGVLVHFEKIGPDPVPAAPERANGVVENGITKKNGEVDGLKRFPADGAWRNILTTMYSRASRAYPGHWPIPESFWPDRNLGALPPRKAHPVISFRCESCDPLVCQDFPFDKYELEPSPLTQFILDRKQPNVCWQVFVSNSSVPGSSPAPFGYLKAATNLLSVNLFIMPYNYPVLLPLIDELKQDPKARTSQAWRARLEKYLSTVPSYFMQPLKKAFSRMNVTNPMMEPEQVQQYSYNILSYLTKVKHVAREEFDSHCLAIATALQHSASPFLTQVNVPTRKAVRVSKKRPGRPSASEFFAGFQVQVGEKRIKTAPSLQFRSALEIKRGKLLDQITKMRANLALQLADRHIPVLEGGRPGTSINLQHAEDLHSLPVSQMGNYQEYVKGLEAIGRGPLREVEPQAIRIHAFGNPFKIDKKNMAVDEVGEGNLLGAAAKVDNMKKRSNTSSVTSDGSRPPRRKPGPLAPDSVLQWRRRRREWSLSSNSSVVSDISDLGSVSSLDDDLASIASDDGSIPSTSSRSDVSLVNGHANLEKKRSADTQINCTLPSKKLRMHEPVKRLDEPTMNEKKSMLGKFVRRFTSTSNATSMIIAETEKLGVSDQRLCLRYALREAKRMKRRLLTEELTLKLSKVCSRLASTSTNNIS